MLVHSWETVLTYEFITKTSQCKNIYTIFKTFESNNAVNK